MSTSNFDARAHTDEAFFNEEADEWQVRPAANDNTANPHVLREEQAAMASRAAQAIRESQAAAAPVSGGGGELMLRTADKVIIEAIDWLWPGFLARKFLNLVCGETAASKSTAIAHIVACETTGHPWPGEPLDAAHGRFPGRVLWLGSEDPFELLTVPRLMACGADLSRVTEIQGVNKGGTSEGRSFSLQDDLALVRAELVKARAAGSQFTVLVIDPITSYLHGGKLKVVQMNDSGHLRTILEPWAKLAAEFDLAIVGVTHLAKDTTRALLHRVLGGGAFAQLCRSLLAVVNRLEEGEHEKALLQVKTNLPDTKRGAWRYKTAQRVVGKCPKGRDIPATYPVWSHFDPALTPEEIAGGARGPVGTVKLSFSTWAKALFISLPPDQWQPSSIIKRQALAEKVCSESWWDKNAGTYLEAQNFGGQWMCRLRR